MRDAPLLLGRYRPLGLLAKGGSSLVYRGHDTHLGRDVAIKLFAAGGASETVQFHDELRVLAELSHHGVVTILDAGVDDSTPTDPRPFIVMELVRGETLRSILAARELSPRRIGEMVFEVAEALEYVHARGVIHRDITPSNIMMVDYGTTFSRPRARLTDFGIAIDSSTVPESDGTTTGTAAYLSPEQVRRETMTSAVDIYSLGLVLLECFTRRIAFPGDALQSATARVGHEPPLVDALPGSWSDLVHAMTEQDPAARPTAAEVATAARRELRSARHKKSRKNEG
ncbi:serine/threonine protein kinase [Lacisediminihabitans sp. G11-30]|uniref:non-specific serine/threonine protein kinase n=1 Tax=Lacisediminihabitans changchengi TaxID=2787634 RepID=A0A934SMT6_9MICO|nr:serine/threonine protein kinase [Lacisediminihabitans changchengi]